MQKIPEHEQFRPLGSSVSADYDPMRTASWWVVSAHV
jgi:hypothetical protein